LECIPINYSFIQGGDGGMEYPMATLVKNASVGTAIHEFMHSWYYGMLGTNESLYPWMDEGFATYGELRTSSFLRGTQVLHLPMLTIRISGWLKVAKRKY